MIRIDIATLFPDMCESYLSESIVGRGRKSRSYRYTLSQYP